MDGEPASQRGDAGDEARAGPGPPLRDCWTVTGLRRNQGEGGSFSFALRHFRCFGVEEEGPGGGQVFVEVSFGLVCPLSSASFSLFCLMSCFLLCYHPFFTFFRYLGDVTQPVYPCIFMILQTVTIDFTRSGFFFFLSNVVTKLTTLHE